MDLQLSANALKVLEKRYLQKDAKGQVVESPKEMFLRVATTIAAVDSQFGADKARVRKTADDFYQMMMRREFMPNSPTLMNAGRAMGQLSACFVLPIEDTMESIFDALKTTAIIHKTGGGTGFSFSKIREKNSIVQATGGVASGPISFMKVFDAATQAVKQGGARRGANMAILRIDHPDILDFIKCKEQDKEIANFNISVAITDKFWQALKNRDDYELVSPLDGRVIKKLNSGTVFDLIVKAAHHNGEPGLIFIDRMNEYNPTPALGNYEATNPCGEQVLLPYESCNLGSINLLTMVKNDSDHYEFDWDKLQVTVRKAVHFLDNVIDANRHPVKAIEEQTKQTRKIGLGVMGWASVLARLGIAYNSDEGIEFAGRVMSFILTESKIKSLELGRQRGVFPTFDKSIYANGGEKMRFRNATLTTLAPTGTISIIAGPCSSGIEPMFAICYYRNVMDQTKLVEVDPVFEMVARERGFYSAELINKIAAEGSIQNIPEIPDDVKKVFVTSHEISPTWHVRMQGMFQKFTDNAVSKTINFPNSATEQDVRDAYLLAYELGCKGITVYRDGSRQDQVLNVTKKETSVQSMEKGANVADQPVEPRPRPNMMTGTTSKIATGCGSLYVTINTDESDKPFEIFNQMGKAGGCASSQLEAIGRLASLALRSGIDPQEVIAQLRGIRCPAPLLEKGTRILSCADAMARVMERRVAQEMKVAGVTSGVMQPPTAHAIVPSASRFYDNANMVGVCPDCGNPLMHTEGCLKCQGCGFSKC